MNKAKWHLYVIETECQQFYTGITTDLERRFSEHLATYDSGGNKGAKYFRGRKPTRIIYGETFDSRSEASKREYEIKKMSRVQKTRLFQQTP